jgi:type I restriction-modification system DNA methylase subunit
MANPKSYSCELCKKVFTQKCDYTRHKIKKAPCISLEEMEQIAKAKQASIDSKSLLISTFKSCLNILRDGGEGITGEKAFKNLSYLLVLKIIEPYIGNEINIDDYEYDCGDLDKDKLLTLVYFSKLSSEKEDNIPDLLKHLWDFILSVNPTTKNIFMKDKGFDIRYQATYRKLFNKLNSIDFSQFDYDIMGNAYEELFQDVWAGKVLGQFFTPPKVKDMMVNLINPQIKPDGTIETCCDPTMGTGGFLKTYLFHILEQANVKAIEPNWDFITTQGLYGKELEVDTYKYAVSNMLISSGHMFQKLGLGDSIREPISEKFDNVLANPPFGIKGLKYDDFESSLKNEYIPIKTDNAISLFIQAIIYMLKINGKGAVVLPDGQDLFSKTNKTLVAVREYLMKTCDLKEIIYLPAGIFTYTSIKTCVFYFVKKREGTSVLKTSTKSSKTKKENREYDFSDKHQTSKVAFYDFNPYEGQGEGVKHLLVEVPIDKLVNNSYSLNYAEYMKDESVEDKYEEGIIVKTLGEVCDFQNGSQLDKKYMVEGNIPIFGGGVKIVGFHNENNRNGNETIVCGTGAYSGYINHNYEKPFWASQCFTMKSKNINIMIDKYLYYYSKIILEQQFMSNQKGTAIPFIRYTQVIDVKIPIPSLEKQKTIVAYLDYIYEKANKTSLTKIEELKQLNEFCLNNQKIFGENSVKELGEVCEVNPENMKSGQYTEINYIDIASVKGGQILELQKLTSDFPSRAKRIVKKGDILYSSVRPNLKGYLYISDNIQNGIASTGFANIRVKEPTTILSKYVYYIMTSDYISDDLINKAKGAQYPAVSFDDFETIKIPIPSLEKQKEIVAYCDYNTNLIKQLENEIENNKELAEQFIKGIVKNVGVDTDVEVNDDELEVVEE